MLEKIEKLRKAPEPVKQHLVAVITIVIVAVITVVWFVFSINSFFKKDAFSTTSTASSTSPVQSQTDGQIQIQSPFSE